MATISSRFRRVSSSRNINDDGTELWNVQKPRSKDMIATPEMAFYCFDALICTLKNTVPTINVEIPNTSCPLFVTWMRKDDEELRGSLGTFEPISLKQGLGEFAIGSALKDDRFDPIMIGEVADLQVMLAILCDFEEGKNFLDWTIGIHGLRLALPGTGKERDKYIVVNLLPEYPIETGWTKVETIDALMRKAGFIGKITGEDRQTLKITRFQTQKITQTYDDFNQFRNWKSRNPNDEYKINSLPNAGKVRRF